MKIAISQLNYIIGDFDGNRNKIVDRVRQARIDGAKVVLFSEQAVSGRPAYDLLNDVIFLDKCNETLESIAEECVDITAIIGVPLQIDNSTISAAAVITNGRVVKYIGKQNVVSRDERLHISHSKGYEFVKAGGKNIAVVIGSDINCVDHDFGSDTDLIVSLKSWRYSRGVIQRRYEFYSDIAYRTQSNVIFLNQIGGQTDIVYDGSSAAFNREGDVVLLMKNFEEDYALIDIDAVNQAVQIPPQNKTANVYRAIKLGLGDFFVKNGFTKACLGLSGGVDSAVVAALASEVLGPENVRVILMPSQFSSEHSVEDARLLADRLGIKYDVAPITQIYECVEKSMSPLFGDNEFDVAHENIQSRIRGLMIMALSNKLGYIALNASNKSELAVGYGTMYGDTIGSLSILGDVYKTEVYDLARYINRSGEIIPFNTITKEPSAELRPEQKDSDSLPLYEVLDAVLYRLIEENQSVDEIITAGFDGETVRNVYKMLVKNEYKRYQTCPVLRMSTSTLGKDHIFPLTYDSSYQL